MDTHVHILSIYCRPNDAILARRVTRLLRWTIQACILTKHPEALIVVHGDFNQPLINQLDFLTETIKLQKVVPENIATHSGGNTLDNIYTNLDYTELKITTPNSRSSDHDMVSCIFKIPHNQSSKPFREFKVVIDQQRLRTLHLHENTLEILSNPQLLNDPCHVNLKDHIPTTRTQTFWWKSLPDWYANQHAHTDS